MDQARWIIVISAVLGMIFVLSMLVRINREIEVKNPAAASGVTRSSATKMRDSKPKYADRRDDFSQNNLRMTLSKTPLHCYETEDEAMTAKAFRVLSGRIRNDE